MIPVEYQEYPCSDYFGSFLSHTGLWDDDAQFWLIVRADKIVERKEVDFLAVGGPGIDLIDFGYRKGREGVWAHYPIFHEFKLLAPSLIEFLNGWYSEEIKV